MSSPIQKYKLNGLMVKMLREQAKLHPQVIADRSGLSLRTLYNIEHGRTPNPRLATIAALAQALDIKIEQLIFKVPTP